MTGPGDPSLTDMFQVLLLLAIPAAILLALRFVTRRDERTQRRKAKRRRDPDVDHLDGLQGCVARQTLGVAYSPSPGWRDRPAR